MMRKTARTPAKRAPAADLACPETFVIIAFILALLPDSVKLKHSLVILYAYLNISLQSCQAPTPHKKSSSLGIGIRALGTGPPPQRLGLGRLFTEGLKAVRGLKKE